MNPLASDLDLILKETSDLWENLRGARIFITGGTGFLGPWFLESFLWANDKLGLSSRIVALSRDPERFKARCPGLAANAALSFCQGNVRDFEFPDGAFSHIIHAAASTNDFRNSDPVAQFGTIVDGTRRALDLAVKKGVSRFLFVSSGAVYGRIPPSIARVSEDFAGALDLHDTSSAYGNGKRAAEDLCKTYSENGRLHATIARCFAIYGPYMDLGSHFAVASFVSEALKGNPIRINGDGTPRRSFLYAADLMVWLWTIFLKGHASRPYNVGSEKELSIFETAHVIAATRSPALSVEVARQAAPGAVPERYIPSTERARGELGLRELTEFPEGIRRTLNWYSQFRGGSIN